MRVPIWPYSFGKPHTCTTNFATGMTETPLAHSEVTEIANQVKDKFQRLVREVIVRMDKVELNR